MFRKSYLHHQEDYIVYAALYGMFFMHLYKQSSRLKNVLDTCINAWKTNHIGLHVQCSLSDDEHKMFEICKDKKN